MTFENFKIEKMPDKEFRVGKISPVDLLAISTTIDFNNFKTQQVLVNFCLEHAEVKVGETWQPVKVKDKDAMFTDPDEVYEFTTKTGIDSLAIAIGTSHGAYKFKPGTKPQLRFDILEEVAKRLPGFPIVLHGASSVPQDLVAVINQYGGKMPDAIGVPEDMLRQAARMAVCKINIDSDLRVAATSAIRKHFFDFPDHFDPRQYLGDARTAIQAVVEHKLVDVLGCAGKADECR